MGHTRTAAVAGLFYPEDPRILQRELQSLLRLSKPAPETSAPKALIAPHAGYVYSGPVAASAYAALADSAERIDHVVLLGPSHRVPLSGMALSSASHFETPLGQIPLDPELHRIALSLPQVQVLDAAHAAEHSLEVHLPFLQMLLKRFSLLPVVVGQADDEAVADLLEAVWGGPETLIVISSDLSHYHPYDVARRLDAATSEAIEHGDRTRIGPDQACGCYPVRGLLRLAARHHMSVRTLDLRNSGDTAGTRDQVVGYGSYAVYEPH